MKKKVIVTAKGASLKANTWKEGQIIECHESLANQFAKDGLVEEIGSETPATPAKEPLKKKK